MAKPSRLNEPYLLAAFICERVLIDQDKIPSYIRAIDTINLPVRTIEPLMVISVNASLVVSLRPGERAGKQDTGLGIWLVDPSGKKRKLFFAKLVTFPEKRTEKSSPTFGINIYLEWEGEGRYSFEIHLNNKKVAVVPLKINLAKPAKS